MSNSKPNEFELLLKEWELCQDDRNAYNRWAWQIGSVFVALSLAALWASTQIKGRAVIGFFFFSMSTLLIWLVFVVWRSRFYGQIITNRLLKVESRLVELVYGKKSQKNLLHTIITCKDRRERQWYKSPRSGYGIFLFFMAILFAWFLLLDFEGIFPIQTTVSIYLLIAVVGAFILCGYRHDEKHKADFVSYDCTRAMKEETKEKNVGKEEKGNHETEKLLDWLFSRELSWAVLILTCFIGLIELLPEVKYYGSSIRDMSLTILLVLVALALVGSCVFAIDRFVRLTNVEAVVEQNLSKAMKKGLYSTMGPIHKILYKIDKDGNFRGLKGWVMPLSSTAFVVIWVVIIILKIL